MNDNGPCHSLLVVSDLQELMGMTSIGVILTTILILLIDTINDFAPRSSVPHCVTFSGSKTASPSRITRTTSLSDHARFPINYDNVVMTLLIMTVTIDDIFAL